MARTRSSRKNKRQFKIPVYQRNYDWISTQSEKLYTDIIHAYENDKKHFTGTIVYIKGNTTSSRLNEDLIIDGQQRVTTIFILLKSLLDKAIEQNETRIEDEIKDYLFNRNCEEGYKLKLKPVKADNLQFCALMKNDKDSFDDNSNIIRNYKLFNKLINESLKNGLFLRDILEGMKKLEVVEIVLDTTQGDDPQTIFESINSTGLELSLADLIRNFLLMDDTNQDTLFEKYWLCLEQTLGNENLAGFLIYYLNYKLSDAVTLKNAYTKFKRFHTDKHHTNELVLQDLKKHASSYSAFIGRKNSYSKIINTLLLSFRLLDQSTVYPFLFAIFDDYNEKIITEPTLIDILTFLRSYCVRRVICEIPSNSLRGLYKTLHTRLFKEPSAKDQYYESLYSLLQTLKTKDKFVNDEDFRTKLIEGSLYTKKNCCKYLLGMIENENCNEVLDISSMTIEHILPQKENSLVWKQELGENYDTTYNKYLHTLGNLTITGYNSQLGARPFQDKKEIIKEHSKANRLNKLILSCEKWGEEAILSRATHLADTILELFQYKKSEILMQQKNNSDDLFTLENTDEVKRTKPYLFSFCGETVSVKSYAGMFEKIAKTLYDLDDRRFDHIAKEKFYVTRSENPYISLSSIDLRKPKELYNSGIYFETNLSASSILQFIKRIIELFEFDSDDFTFRASSGGGE